MNITKTFVKKVNTLLDTYGICAGLGKPIPGEMCIEALICYAKGAEHSDTPTCVHHVIRTLVISLNDANWSSNQARAQGLKRLAIAQLGTVDNFDSELFSKRVALHAVSVLTPIALRVAAKIHPEEKHKNELEKHADILSKIVSLDNAADAARAAVWAAWAAAAVDTADAAARAAAQAAAWAAVDTADAAARAAADEARAARAAAQAAAWAADTAPRAARAARAAADAARAADSNQILIDFAEFVTQVLIEMRTPGSKFL